MPQPILIGIHGVKRAGKNTTADWITEFASEFDPALSVRQRGFADKAKWAWARQFHPTITLEEAIKWVDEFKDSDMRVVMEHPGAPHRHHVDLPFRLCMAQFSTQGARQVFGEDFWVEQLVPKYPGVHFEGGGSWWDNFDRSDLGLITDVRFENEVTRIAVVDGYNIKVKRKDAENAVRREAEEAGREIHDSELGLPDELFDYVIDNSDNNMELAKARTEHVFKSIIEREDRGDRTPVLH